MDYSFELSFPVTTRENDSRACLRPSALLGMLQETAAKAAADLHVSRTELMERHGCFWMMVRLWYRLERPVRWGETLTVRTWHRGNRGLLMYRDFDLYVGEEPVGQAVTVWVLADKNTHEMTRLEVLDNLEDTTGGSLCKQFKPMRLHLPQKMTVDEVRRMHESDLDINGHVNNTAYADFACDALHCENLTRSQFVAEMQINYNRECLVGEHLTLFTGTDGAHNFVRGEDRDGLSRFEAQVTVREC